jgi:hypothetical protein
MVLNITYQYTRGIVTSVSSRLPSKGELSEQGGTTYQHVV